MPEKPTKKADKKPAKAKKAPDEVRAEILASNKPWMSEEEYEAS